MAFTIANLENHGGSGAGKKVWSYATSDAMATVIADDYFLAGTINLTAGDVIYVSASDGSGFIVIASASSTTVTTTGLGLEAASASTDAASIADGDEVAIEVTVTGAALGDYAIASCSVDVADLVINAAVTAADTVTVILANNTGGAVDLAAAIYRAKVIKAGV